MKGVSLEVAPGETLGIVGESGCGKTTLARMLVGLIPPTDGRIEINGTDRRGDSTRRFGRDIQYVFQDPTSSLNPRMTIRDILGVPLRHLHGMDGPARAARIREIIDAVNLREEFLDRHPHEFSGGQAQRIGIARALAADARILVLDEPVSALDVSIQAQVLNLLADLKAEFGVLNQTRWAPSRSASGSVKSYSYCLANGFAKTAHLRRTCKQKGKASAAQKAKEAAWKKEQAS